MRAAVVALALLAAGCATSSTGGGSTESEPKSNFQCEATRHGIERSKYAVTQAEAAGDSVEANRQRQEVELGAQIARGMADCDISDLVGDNVGR